MTIRWIWTLILIVESTTSSTSWLAAHQVGKPLWGVTPTLAPTSAPTSEHRKIKKKVTKKYSKSLKENDTVSSETDRRKTKTTKKRRRESQPRPLQADEPETSPEVNESPKKKTKKRKQNSMKDTSTSTVSQLPGKRSKQRRKGVRSEKVQPEQSLPLTESVDSDEISLPVQEEDQGSMKDKVEVEEREGHHNIHKMGSKSPRSSSSKKTKRRQKTTRQSLSEVTATVESPSEVITTVEDTSIVSGAPKRKEKHTKKKKNRKVKEGSEPNEASPMDDGVPVVTMSETAEKTTLPPSVNDDDTKMTAIDSPVHASDDASLQESRIEEVEQPMESNVQDDEPVSSLADVTTPTEPESAVADDDDEDEKDSNDPIQASTEETVDNSVMENETVDVEDANVEVISEEEATGTEEQMTASSKDLVSDPPTEDKVVEDVVVDMRTESKEVSANDDEEKEEQDGGIVAVTSVKVDENMDEFETDESEELEERASPTVLTDVKDEREKGESGTKAPEMESEAALPPPITEKQSDSDQVQELEDASEDDEDHDEDSDKKYPPLGQGSVPVQVETDDILPSADEVQEGGKKRKKVSKNSESTDKNKRKDDDATSKETVEADPYLEGDVVDFIGKVLNEDIDQVRSWTETDTSSGAESSYTSTKVNEPRGGSQVASDLSVEEAANKDTDLDGQPSAIKQPSSGEIKPDGELSSSKSDSTTANEPAPSTSNDVEKLGSEATRGPSLPRKVKLDRKSLEESEDKDTDASVSIVTWNLAEESPAEADAEFIKAFRKAGIKKGTGSDLVLISAQECENIKPRRNEGRRSREYRRLMIKMLGKDYVPIALHLLGGIQFGLFARRSFLPQIEDVTVADVTCGIGNVFHNKGAICAFLTIKAKNPRKEDNVIVDDDGNEIVRSKTVKMVFVTAHMAAHVKNSDARDADFWRISNELESQAPEGFLPIRTKEFSQERSFLFDSVDRAFFCGDLNYRIDLPREITEYTVLQNKVKKMNGWSDELMKYEQLFRSMAEGKSFPGFVEGKIHFAPTFKFDKETGEYDTSHKQRIPAWTDRILFKPQGTRVLSYQSVPDAQHSDHRPVFGTFRVNMEGRELPPSPKRRRKPTKTTSDGSKTKRSRRDGGF